jgi:hypothetical protein
MAAADVLYEVMSLMVKRGPLSLEALELEGEEGESGELKA